MTNYTDGKEVGDFSELKMVEGRRVVTMKG